MIVRTTVIFVLFWTIAAAAKSESVGGDEKRADSTCKVLFFRHIEKTGGTSMRTLLNNALQKTGDWMCKGQYCKDGNGATSPKECIDYVNSLIASAEANPHKPLDLKIYFEFHSGAIPESANIFMSLLEKLRDAGAGCDVVRFVIIRDPFEQAFSDFNYFYKGKEQKGEIGKSFNAFIDFQAEDILMRLGPGKSFFGRIQYRAEFVEIYKESPELREELYQIGMMELSKYDIIATTENLNQWLCHMCLYMTDDEKYCQGKVSSIHSLSQGEFPSDHNRKSTIMSALDQSHIDNLNVLFEASNRIYSELKDRSLDLIHPSCRSDRIDLEEVMDDALLGKKALRRF